MLLLRPALKLFRDSISTFDLMIQRSTFLRTNCRWPDSNRHGPVTAQRILSPLRLPFRHIGCDETTSTLHGMGLFQMRAPFSRRAAPNSAGEPFLRVPIGLNSGGIIETQAANDTS